MIKVRSTIDEVSKKQFTPFAEKQVSELGNGARPLLVFPKMQYPLDLDNAGSHQYLFIGFLFLEMSSLYGADWKAS